MKILPSSKSSKLIGAFIPGLFAMAVLTMLEKVFLHPKRSESNIANPPSDVPGNGPNSLLESLFRVAEDLDKILLEGINNYLIFLMIMYIVSAILQGADIIRALFMKKRTQSNAFFISQWKTVFAERDWSLLNRIKQILLSLLIGSLMFCLYQVLLVCLGSTVSFQVVHEMNIDKTSNPALQIADSARILEEETSSFLQLPEHKKPSLSIGKVLGQVDIYAISIQVSKDGKTAFAITNFPSALKIIDVSEPESPAILSSLVLPSGGSSNFVSKALLVSPDETTLYLSSFEYLLIIDIKNLKSPQVLAKIKDKAFLTDEKFDGFAKGNLLLSRDNKFLFISEYGLQVFDVSEPTAPVLLLLLHSRTYAGVLVPSSIVLSADKKRLYYSDGGLWIYDIEDPKNMRVMSSFNRTLPISSIMISDDARTAFVLSSGQESHIHLQSLDISDIYSIKEGQVTLFEKTSTCLPIFLERAPGNLFLMILFMDDSKTEWHDLLIFDTREQRLIKHEKLLIKDAFSVVFTEDYRRVFMGNNDKFEIAELYLDYPNKHAFTVSSNALQSFDVNFKFFSMKTEKMLYSVTDEGFRIDEIERSNRLKNICFYKAKEILNMVISKDNKRAFLMYENRVEILDISKPENISILGEYTVKARVGQPKIRTLAPSLDGKAFYLTYAAFFSNYFEIIDILDPKKATRMSSTELGEDAPFVTPLLSNDGCTLFVISHSLEIYNITDPANPSRVSKLSFVQKDFLSMERPSIFATLAPNGKTLFIMDESGGSTTVVSVIDVSNLIAPQTRSEFRFNILGLPDKVYAEKMILASEDSKRVFIARPSSLMVVDASNLNDPKYLGSIKFTNDRLDYLKDFRLSDGDRKAFILTRGGKFVTTSLEPKYSTFILQDNLMLGERYNLNLQVLKMNEYLDYDQMEVDYRFTKFSLVETKSMQSGDFENVVLKTPPSWMNFDLKSQTLSVEARRKSDIKPYKVYFGFSTQIPKDAFSKLTIGNEPLKYQDIFSLLIALDYVDNQLFLTENFAEYSDFMLPSQYEPIEKEIYQIMRGYSFGTYNELRILESLNVSSDTDNNKLKISTTSGTNLKIEISLVGEAQFLHRYCGLLMPTITNNKSRLVMEGSLKDINLALRKVVVNLGNGKPCDGEMIVDDKLNPVRTEFMKDISRYFSHNMPPGLNKNFDSTIQDQVDKESLKTGQYFQIKLNPKTFFDNFTDVENLNYQLVFMKNNNETTLLPSWVSFSDLTLMGTAPEEIFDRTFEFRLIVKNEFQELKVPLKLHVSISSSFVMKLLMKYSPYILSIVGLLISANKIFNIICKSTYKHPKIFSVDIGQEINSEVIFPVGFIRQEIQEAKGIMKLIEKKAGGKNKRKLLAYFVESGGKLDKLKIFEAIKESLKKLSIEEKKLFALYLGGSHPKRIINQIIINILTEYMLGEDRETRVCYEKLKKNWPEFVDWDLINSCFKINDEMMNAFLNRSSNESILTKDDRGSLLSSSFIEKSNINIDLLKDSILAYAFEFQNIDILPGHVQINVKEKVKTSFWKEFLKLDLQDCPLREKSKIGYGIECFKEYHTVFFNGVARPDIRNVVLVVQITNLQHRILKELWIFGEKSEDEFEGAEIEREEIDARGKGYEIF